MFRLFVYMVYGIIFSQCALAQFAPCSEQHCVAIIDAGSTGSRLHVYHFDYDKTQTPIHIKEIWSKRINPGFSTIDSSPSTIHHYLNSLLSDAPEKNLSVYFYATAGMRLLPASKQKLHYDELKRWFNQQPEWRLIEAKTITGNEEALYDWLSVNYHLGKLQHPEERAVGVMDMGGASVQIAFPLKNHWPHLNHSQMEVNVYGQPIHLFVHSFLGLGQTEMSHQFLNSIACFANDYPLPDGEMGHGNASSCEQEITALLNAVHGVNHLIQPILASQSIDNWYSIGGLSNLADNPLFHFKNNEITNDSLLGQANSQICQQQWETLEAQFPNDDYFPKYCLFSAYYYALMVDGYGLLPHQKINYIPSKQNMDWTTGVVLQHTSALHSTT